MCGCACIRYAVALLKTNLPAFFSCANDYSDLKGETAIMEKILGARYRLRSKTIQIVLLLMLKHATMVGIYHAS